MASDYTFVKGFRTSAAYFVENEYADYNISATNARRVGGKVRGINWTVRQNITKTGNVGDGRNYKQQYIGNYDANASMNFEVSDPSFLRFGMGDIAKFNDNGESDSSPFFFVEAELSGLDWEAGDATLLRGNDVTAYRRARLRPFSMLLYDIENVPGGTVWNDNVDYLKGCMINDFSLSSGIGSPLICNVNMSVREISYRRHLEIANTPDFTSTDTSTDDYGNGELNTLTPAASLARALEPPLMYYNGGLWIDGNQLGQVTSFNYSLNHQLLIYRELGDRFIVFPQVGMRMHTLSCNVVMRLPPNSTGEPANNQTSILELIKNHLGYPSDAAFPTSGELRPALATNNSATSPQTTVPIEKGEIVLNLSSTSLSGAPRGMKIAVRLAAIEGFGLPVTLENGLIEIPINFSVRGYPYNRVGDGSYIGYNGPGTTFSSYKPTISWWYG